MNYKVQDIIKIVIPGLFLVFALSIVFFVIDTECEYVPTGLSDMLKTPFSNAIAVFLPFGGFIVGYLINIMASGAERYSYKKKIIVRPSLYVLQKWDKEYYVVSSEEIFKTLECPASLTEENARLAFRKAKMRLQYNEVLENFYLQSILSRNMLITLLFVAIITLIITFCHYSGALIITVIIASLMTLMLFRNWRRRSFLYVERVFAEVTINKDGKSSTG